MMHLGNWKAPLSSTGRRDLWDLIIQMNVFVINIPLFRTITINIQCIHPQNSQPRHRLPLVHVHATAETSLDLPRYCLPSASRLPAQSDLSYHSNPPPHYHVSQVHNLKSIHVPEPETLTFHPIGNLAPRLQRVKRNVCSSCQTFVSPVVWDLACKRSAWTFNAFNHVA